MVRILVAGALGAVLLAVGGCRRSVTAPAPVPPAPAPLASPSLPPAPSVAPVPRGRVVAAPVAGAAFARQNVPFETMVGEARRMGRPAILYVCATWCGACSRMNREVLSDARVQERLRAFPTAKYDPDTPAGRALADRYDIWAYPEMVIVDGSGRELRRVKGAGDPDRLLGVLAAW